MIKKFIQQNWQFILIIIVTSLFLIPNLNHELFIDWDECLYSVYVREMKKSGNYLINQWNGYNDMQKPPLYSWILQIPFAIAQNEFLPRFLSLTASLTLLTTIFFFAKKYLSKTIGLIACLIILSVDIYIDFSQKLNTDIFYSLFIFLGFWSWLGSEKNRRLIIITSLFFALAIMVKGLSITPFLTAIFISIFFHFEKERLIDFFIMLGLMILIILPWHIVVFLKYKQDFLQIYFLENIIQRSRYPIELHYGGRLYYFRLLFKQFFPWILILLIVPIIYLLKIKKWFKSINYSKEIKKHSFLFSLITLILIPFFSFTIIKTKIPWYLIPIYPFLGLMISYCFTLILNKIRWQPLKLLILILLTGDVLMNLLHMTRWWKEKKLITYRNQVAIEAKKISNKELFYLVAQPERLAKALLDQSPNLKIRSTFVYGGNPCAVYYSEKKVHYYYSIEEFINQLKIKNRLFMIENGDLKIIEGYPIKKIYQNQEYTLFKTI